MDLFEYLIPNLQLYDGNVKHFWPITFNIDNIIFCYYQCIMNSACASAITNDQIQLLKHVKQQTVDDIGTLMLLDWIRARQCRRVNRRLPQYSNMLKKVITRCSVMWLSMNTHQILRIMDSGTDDEIMGLIQTRIKQCDIIQALLSFKYHLDVIRPSWQEQCSSTVSLISDVLQTQTDSVLRTIEYHSQKQNHQDDNNDSNSNKENKNGNQNNKQNKNGSKSNKENKNDSQSNKENKNDSKSNKQNNNDSKSNKENQNDSQSNKENQNDCQSNKENKNGSKSNNSKIKKQNQNNENKNGSKSNKDDQNNNTMIVSECDFVCTGPPPAKKRKLCS